VLAGATVIIGRIRGIQRPALATVLPTVSGYVFVIDCGANVDSRPEFLVQFAQMGSIYMREIMGINNPRVGLVNIGAEAEKGNALCKEAYPMLSAADINFIGNTEARDIPLGAIDVAVCDGFVGNVILKYSEGFAKGIMSMIKEELMSSTLSKMGAMLSKGAYGNLRKRFDYTEVGGAPFIGLNGLVVKAHGSSNAKAIMNACKQCSKFIQADIPTKIQEKI
jgi:glycerol-3-phosphate acyltransferase PlsX